MYYLNKIVEWVLSPLGVLFIGLAMGGIMHFYASRLSMKGDLCARKLKVAANWLILGITMFMWVMSCGVTTRFIGAELEKEWEVEGKPHGDIGGFTKVDAIVVLGGGMGYHFKCGAPEILGGADRVWLGARLYKAGLSKIISLSGYDVEKSTVSFMNDLGVPREAFMYFPEARNTEEESKPIFAALSKIFVGRKPRILLVTSAWHMPRAKLLFERVGFDVIPAPADFEMSYILESPIKASDFFPRADSLVRNSYALKEWVARFGYGMLRR